MEATLRITRTSQYANKLRAYSIFLDGARVGKIKDGETVTYPLSPGSHTVQARIDWCRTKPVEITVKPGQDIPLEVGCYAGGWRLLLALFDAIWPGRWLYLKASQLGDAIVQDAVHSYREHLAPEQESEEGLEDEPVLELSDEENQRQAEQIQKVQILCQLAEAHLEDLSDEYESSKLEERIDKAVVMAKEITDPFYFGSALHPVIKLSHQAGWKEKKDKLLEMVADPFIKEKIIEDINE